MANIKNTVLGQPAGHNQYVIKRRSNLINKYISFRGDSILDIGCGNGAQTIEATRSFKRCIGLDVEINRLREFQTELRKRDINNCLLILYDGSALPLSDDSVDVLTCIEVLEHVRDQHKTLSEAYRILKKGGKAIFSVPNKKWIFETHGADLPLLKWNRVPFFSWLPKKIHDRYARARIYTQNDIFSFLTKHGFSVFVITYMVAPMDVVNIKLVQKFLRKTIFRPDETKIGILSTSIFVFCEKSV